jgi:hypothetical protein
MSDIRVSYQRGSTNTGTISINNINIHTSSFTTIDDSKNIKYNTDDNQFTTFQKRLRYLDCVKDAAVGVNVGQYVKILYNNVDYELPFNVLGEWEDRFIQQNEQIIHHYSWTKKTKDSTLEPLLDNRVVFKESGLNPDYYITPPIPYVGNIATEVIDPAGRSPIEGKDIKFPVNNQKLILERSFMEFFGFDNCSLESTRVSNGKYDYKINIGAIENFGGAPPVTKKPRITTNRQTKTKKNTKLVDMTSTDQKIKRNATQKISPKTTKIQNYNSSNIVIDNDISVFDQNIGRVEWFQGNKEKNKFIKSTNAPTNIKRALFISKELGDVLQVLIMFIWSKLNDNQLYSITTCDKVVCLLCMVLQINCILTYAEKATDKTKKMRTIDVFEPSGNTSEKSYARFELTKKEILDHNTNFINCLVQIKQSETGIYVSGITQPIIVNSQIYDKFINDLTNINILLEKQTIEPTTDPAIIDTFIKLIKINFTFIEFIRVSKQKKITLTMQSIYTSNNRMWIDVINPSFSKYRYGKDSFYKLIKTPELLFVNPNPEPSPSQIPIQTTEAPMTPLQVQPPNISKLTPMETNDALDIKFSEPISLNTYSAAGGERNTVKRKIHHISPNSNVFKSIDYLEYPDTALFYDKDENITYNLYDELNTQVLDHLRSIRKTAFFDHVYTNLLHHFYLTNQVMYDNELITFINQMFSGTSSPIIRRKVKVISKKNTKKIITPSKTSKNSNNMDDNFSINRRRIAVQNISPEKKTLLTKVATKIKKIQFS